PREGSMGPGLARRFRGETAAFTVAVLLHLIPIWGFPYLGTQDGPSHLSNAVVLKDYGSPGTRYHDFFEIRWEPLPNWASHFLLVVPLYVVPPLAAEKLLATAYILGFAWSFRYFLGAMGERCRPLAVIGLLFLFNRCFFLGFYNFCLSITLYWVVVGY